MDPASIMSIISFAGGCTNILAKTAYSVYQAPGEILSLQNEVSDLRLVLFEWKNACLSTALSGISATSLHALEAGCMTEVQALTQELSDLTGVLCRQDGHGSYHFQRHQWLLKKPKVLKLKQGISVAMQNLRDLLALRTGTKVDRIELRLESMTTMLASMQVAATKASTATTPNEVTTECNVQPVSLTAYIRNSCDIYCSCTCHLRHRLGSPSAVSALLGRVFVGYIGLPMPAVSCSTRSCMSSGVRAMRLTYVFPTWFIHARLEIAMGSNFFGAPEFNIKMQARREYTSEHSMFQLARQGKIAAMKERLSLRMASPNDVSLRGGNTAFDWALQCAVNTSDLEPCQLLIKAGADLDIENDYGGTDIMNASQVMFTTQNKTLAESLSLMLGVQRSVDSWNFFPLHKIVLQILKLDLGKAIKTLGHASHLNLLDVRGRTALHWACLRGNSMAVKQLLLAGADTSCIDLEGHSALHFAIQSGEDNCVDMLLLAGADVHSRDDRGDSPMLVAAWAHDKPDIIRSLSAAGASVMSRNGGGVTALQSAACLDHAENARAFLDLGADINAFDRNGDTPLFETIYYSNMKVLDVLLTHEIDYSHTNRSGWTILHVLALYGTVESLTKVTPMLQGVDCLLRDNSGRTAFEALADRLEHDEQFALQFGTLIEDFEEHDVVSIESFESALEMQLSSGVV